MGFPAQPVQRMIHHPENAELVERERGVGGEHCCASLEDGMSRINRYAVLAIGDFNPAAISGAVDHRNIFLSALIIAFWLSVNANCFKINSCPLFILRPGGMQRQRNALLCGTLDHLHRSAFFFQPLRALSVSATTSTTSSRG